MSPCGELFSDGAYGAQRCTRVAGHDGRHAIRRASDRLTTPDIRYVAAGHDYARVHRLAEPVARLTRARHRTACGLTLKPLAAGAAGWHDWNEAHSATCKRCRAVE